MKILVVLGTRPEIIRLCLIIKRLDQLGIKTVIVHTGQNYDPKLSANFFKELDLREPDIYLGIKEPTAGAQIGKIISLSEETLIKEKPDYLLLLGDTNSALSAIPASRLGIPILHMEAGNRCFDWRVPEEKNRKIVDHISDWLLPYTERSQENLIREGISSEYIFVSGNPIAEILNHYESEINKSTILDNLKLKKQDYFLVTLHREENVDNPETLKTIIAGLRLVTQKFSKPLIWSVHPRTQSKLDAGNYDLPTSIKTVEPLGFFDFANLEKNAFCVLSDSGTVQEECSLFKIPTVTIRETTERPETVECGSNILSGTTDPQKILQAVEVMTASARNWVSPYEMDKEVSDKIVKFITHRKPAKTK